MAARSNCPWLKLRSVYLHGLVTLLILLCSGDIEVNPEYSAANVNIEREEKDMDVDQGFLSRCSKNLLFAHLNIRRVISKLDDLMLLLERGGDVVFGINESWLDGAISDIDVFLPGMKVFQKDRNRRGGGVLVYVSERLKAIRRMDLEMENVEAVWIEIRTKNISVLVCNVYRPPNSQVDWMVNFANMMEKAAGEKMDRVVLGDFNCNMLKPNEGNAANLAVGCDEMSLSDHGLIYGLTSVLSQRQKHSYQYVRCLGKCDTGTFCNDLEAAPWGVMDLGLLEVVVY